MYSKYHSLVVKQGVASRIIKKKKVSSAGLLKAAGIFPHQIKRKNEKKKEDENN